MALHQARSDTTNGSSLSYKRIVVKAGTNVLTSKRPSLDGEVMASLATQIADVQTAGAQVVLVTSGAIAAGREAIGTPQDSNGLGVSQMLAAIGQSRLMRIYEELFSKRGIVVAQALLTRRDIDDQVGYLNIRNTLERLLEHSVVPIVNENDVVDTAEINQERFGDNDTLSAVVADLVNADLLIMLTDTRGLFTADPNRDPSATLVPRVERIDESVLKLAEVHRSKTTRGGMASKLEAAQKATSAGVTVVITSGAEANVVARVARGEASGTMFPATARNAQGES
jgi:glutamate 5-kinase